MFVAGRLPVNRRETGNRALGKLLLGTAVAYRACRRLQAAQVQRQPLSCAAVQPALGSWCKGKGGGGAHRRKEGTAMDLLGGVHWPQRPSGQFFLGAREAREAERGSGIIASCIVASWSHSHIICPCCCTRTHNPRFPSLRSHPPHRRSSTLVDARYPPSLLPALPPALQDATS